MNSPYSPRNYEKPESSRNRWLLDSEREKELAGTKAGEKEEKDKKPKEAETSKKEKTEEKKVGEKEKKPSPEEKQEKRSEIVERSLAYSKLYEDEPIPKDPETIARLVVAERIVALNEKLHSPDKKDEFDQKTVEETLDYMCLLSEKLEEPELEVPPEIETAYTELLELAAEVASGDEEPQEILDQINELSNMPAVDTIEDELTRLREASLTPTQVTPEAPRTPRKLTLATAFVTILHRIRHSARGEHAPTDTPEHAPNSLKASPEFSAGGRASHDTYEHSASQSSGEHTREIHKNNERYLRPLPHNASEYHVTALGRPHIHPLAAVALASIIAAKLHRPPEISTPRTSGEFKLSPSSAYAPVETALQPSHTEQSHNQNDASFSADTKREYTPSTLHRPLEEQRREQVHLAAPIPGIESIPMHAASDRKLEHMTLQSLLVLAHGVHLGYGQYLKEEFEKGTINKDGLIKVLKARAKGKDFSREFREQVTHYRQLKVSPEFLREDRVRKAQPLISDVQKEDSSPAQVASASQPSSPAPQSAPILPQPIATPTGTPATRSPELTPHKETTGNLWIAGIIIGLIVLGLLIWTLI